jgi:drug/metabolite transporter (DMT)-like permease
MLWLLVVIPAYFLFAIVALGDKYLLRDRIPHPKVYAFYVGLLGTFSLFLIPLGFSIPKLELIIFSLLTGALFTFALFQYYKSLYLFEASRIVPAIGGFLPIFTFILITIFLGEKEALGIKDILSFVLLILGSFLLTFEKDKLITLKGLQLSLVVAFLYSLAFILTKFVYSALGFWPGFIWMRIGGGLAALIFLFAPEVREEIFKKKVSFQKKTSAIFIFNQGLGAIGFILQNWAISLAGLVYLPIINALQGIQYGLLFIFATLISLRLPQVIKERISKEIIFQKIIAILIIGGGLAVLVLK